MNLKLFGAILIYLIFIGFHLAFSLIEEDQGIQVVDATYQTLNQTSQTLDPTNQTLDHTNQTLDRTNQTLAACEGDVVYCYNGGKCIPNDSKRGYRCRCRGRFVGDKCQQADFCSSLPCQNHAECINTRDTYICRCDDRRFFGRNCQLIRVNYCASLPCQNGAECVNRDDGYNCKCPQEFTGDHCEIDRGFDEKCRNISDYFRPKCCKILNKCCLNDPRNFVCGSWPSGKHATLYYNKCELKKARCFDLSQCILKREIGNCDGEHVPIMTRATPCDYCPCANRVIGGERSELNLDQILRQQQTVREALSPNCTVKCETAPPQIPYCLKEARRRIAPKSFWDYL